MMVSSHSQYTASRGALLFAGVGVMLTFVLASSTSLAATGLFPSQNKRMSTPIDRSALPPLEPVMSDTAAKPVELSAPPSNGPLRIVIPNIQSKENAVAAAPAAAPTVPEKVAEQPKPIAAKPKRVAAKPKPTQPAVAAAAPVSQAAAYASQIADLANLQPSAGGARSAASIAAENAMIDYALSLLNDGFSNAVILDFLVGKTSSQTISSVPEPLPVAWIIEPADPTQQFSALTSMGVLAPAAGDPAPLLTPAIPTPNAVPAIQTAATDPTTPPAPIIPNAAAAIAAPNNAPAPKTTATVTPDDEEDAESKTTAASNGTNTAQPSDPEPTLSSGSKKVLDKLPPAPVKSNAAKTKVDIDRATEKGDFGGNVSVNSHEAMGIKMDLKRPKLDMNYQLEKAYNAVVAGKNEEAILIYQDVLTNDSKNKDALFGLATTYHRVGQLDLARTLYGKLLEIDPNYRDGLNNFLVLLGEEAPNEALVKMEELERKNPGFSPIPAQMAIIYQKIGNTDKAVDKMYNALALAPENITYRYNLAVLLDKQRNYEQASKLYQQVLDSAAKGTVIPWDTNKIQQRLTFIRSNGSR